MATLPTKSDTQTCTWHTPPSDAEEFLRNLIDDIMCPDLHKLCEGVNAPMLLCSSPACKYGKYATGTEEYLLRERSVTLVCSESG